MGDQDQAAVAAVSDEPETPAAFLTGVATTLKSSDDLDEDLAEILATHVLVAEPAKDAVANAKAAIVALAQRRATPAKQEPASG